MKITRTVVETIVHLAKISIADGQISTEELPSISIFGTTKASNKDVLKVIAKNYPKDKVVEIKREVREEIRGMDLEEFVKLSEVVTRPVSQLKKNKGERK